MEMILYKQDCKDCGTTLIPDEGDEIWYLERGEVCSACMIKKFKVKGVFTLVADLLGNSCYV